MLYEYILIELQNLVTRKVVIQSVSLKNSLETNSTFFWYYMYLQVQLKYLVKWAVDLVHGGVETC